MSCKLRETTGAPLCAKRLANTWPPSPCARPYNDGLRRQPQHTTIGSAQIRAEAEAEAETTAAGAEGKSDGLSEAERRAVKVELLCCETVQFRELLAPKALGRASSLVASASSAMVAGPFFFVAARRVGA